MLPALVVSEAIGHSTSDDADRIWDDLKAVGLWPAKEYIKKVLAVSIWTGTNKINAIEVKYERSNDEPKTVSHGKKDGTKYTVSVENTPNQHFVGMFGAEKNDSDEPTLRRLGFLLYDQSTGQLTVQGPFPNAAETSVTGFTTLGMIVGFSGTLSTSGSLDTLAVYKLQAGSPSFGISNI